MKRLLLFIALVSVAHGAGSVQQNSQTIGSGIVAISFYWTGDSVNGSVPATAATGTVVVNQGFRVISIETTPGSPAPTNGYSITLIDSAGVDIMAGASASLSSSSAQSFAGSPTAPPLYGTFNFTLTGNSVASAKGSAIVYLAPFNQVIGLSPTAPSFPSQGANLIFASPNGASGSPGFRGIAIPGDFGANAQGNGGKVQLSTGTTTLGDCVKYDANGNAIDSGGSCFTLPAGVQTQYLRIQPGTSNNTTAQFAGLPILNPNDYNFPAQTPGGSLSIGNNTVTLTPGPLGVNSSATNYSLYISGGTGTAEPAPTVAGGSCNGTFQASCTVIINCANTHTGAWTISSVAGGLPEADMVGSQLPSGGAVIQIVTPISALGRTSFHGSNIVEGLGTTANMITRAASFQSSDVLAVTGTGNAVMLLNLGISAGGGSALFASVRVSNAAVLWMVNSVINSGVYGVISDGAATTYLSNVIIQNFDAVNQGQANLLLDCVAAATENNIFITNSAFVQGAASNRGLYSLLINCADGIQMSNSGLGALNAGIKFNPSGTKYNWNMTFTGLFIDNVGFGGGAGAGFQFAGTPTPGNFGHINITGNEVHGENLSNSSFCLDLGFSTAANVDNLIVSNNIFMGCGTNVTIGALSTPKDIDISNNQIVLSKAGSGVFTSSGITGVSMVGNSIGANTQFGITLNGNNSMNIVGNDLCTNTSGPISTASGNILTGVVALNNCVDTVSVAVASVAALPFPFNPSFTITGVTGVTSVTGLWAGRVGTFITTGGAVTFTAGATIGNTCTTTQNKPYQYYFDGTKVWIAGSGC